MTPERTGRTETGNGGAGRGRADDAINRLVAERVMGREPCGAWVQEMSAAAVMSGGVWLKHGGACKHQECYPTGHPRKVVTDPAAWGALLVWLADRHTMVRMGHGTREWWAVVCGSAGDFGGASPLPGRALALAALRAYGVEVPDGHP